MRNLLIFLIGLGLCATPGQDAKAQKLGDIFPELEFEIATRIIVKIARPKHDCEKGLWICFVEVMVETKVIGSTAASRMVEAELLLPRDRNGVYLRLYGDLPGEGGEQNLTTMYAESGEEYEMPDEVCERLGLDRLVLYPGDYELIDIENGQRLIHIDALVQG